MKSIKLLWIACLAFLFTFCPLISAAQDFDELNEQADKEYANNNYQKAIDLANRSLNLKNNPRSYFVRGNSKYSLKDYQGALDDYNTAISDYSSYYSTDEYKARLYYWRGRSKQNLGKYDDAITDLSTSLDYNYEDPGYAYWNRGNCYYNIYKYKKSDDDYAKAIDKISDTKDLAKLYKYRGDCSGSLVDYANADIYYTRAISYNADYYYAYWWRAYYRNLNSKDDDAIADYNKAASIIEGLGANKNSDDLSSIYRNLALLYYDKEANDDALEAINKAMRADPNNTRAFQTRADIYQQMKEYDKARADYDNAITLVNDDKTISNLYFDRSYKLDWKVLDYKSAMEDLNLSIALDGKDGMKFWHRAITYDYKKDYTRALADCAKAMDLYGDKTSSGLYALRASLKEKSGDTRGAVSDYQAAIKLDKEDASNFYNLGRLFKTKLNNDELAQMNLNKAIDLSKERGSSAQDAYALVINGKKEEAIASVLEKVEKYRDDKYNYKWQLHNAACIYALSGNKVKALEYLDRSLAAGYNDYNHLVNDRDLVSLLLEPQYKIILSKYKVPRPKW